MIKKLSKRSLLLALGLAVGLGASTACGDDGGGGDSKPKKPKKKKGKAKAAKAGPVVVLGYPKIAEEHRHEFIETDFLSDNSGEVNRDPFRSFVLKPTIEQQEGDEPLKVVDVCTEGKVRWGAQNYSVRDLALIGLVKRGRSYAQFTDRGERDSWIVRKGDCIGQEKAVVEEIGVGYLRLSITPPAPPGAPSPPAQKQDIPLHPNELAIPDEIVNAFDEDSAEKSDDS